MRVKMHESIREGYFANGADDGPYGAFFVQGPCGCQLKIVSGGGDETGWEHVSVSTPRRPPNWLEMCFVKMLQREVMDLIKANAK